MMSVKSGSTPLTFTDVACKLLFIAYDNAETMVFLAENMLWSNGVIVFLVAGSFHPWYVNLYLFKFCLCIDYVKVRQISKFELLIPKIK